MWFNWVADVSVYVSLICHINNIDPAKYPVVIPRAKIFSGNPKNFLGPMVPWSDTFSTTEGKIDVLSEGPSSGVNSVCQVPCIHKQNTSNAILVTT